MIRPGLRRPHTLLNQARHQGVLLIRWIAYAEFKFAVRTQIMRLNTTHYSLAVAVSAFALLGASQVSAYSAGDTIVRGGLISAVPGGSYSSVADGAFNLRADSDEAFGLSAGYMLTDSLSVELLVVSPFKHDIEARRKDGDDIGETNHLPPTLTAVYYPFSGRDLGMDVNIKPYLGVGLNYSTFWDEKIDIPDASLKLEDSFGVAGQIGIDVPISDRWSLGASAYYIDLDTDAELNGGDIGTVEIDPAVYRANIVYRF